ncbi:hypothetical protein ACP70R_029981 [Stipagrostis hirtigluma subsp. patula]
MATDLYMSVVSMGGDESSTAAKGRQDPVLESSDPARMSLNRARRNSNPVMGSSNPARMSSNPTMGNLNPARMSSNPTMGSSNQLLPRPIGGTLRRGPAATCDGTMAAGGRAPVLHFLYSSLSTTTVTVVAAHTPEQVRTSYAAVKKH